MGCITLYLKDPGIYTLSVPSICVSLRGPVIHLSLICVIKCWNTNFNGKKVSPESERYRKCLFGYLRIVHRDICTFTLVFSYRNKSRAGQGAPWLEEVALCTSLMIKFQFKRTRLMHKKIVSTCSPNNNTVCIEFVFSISSRNSLTGYFLVTPYVGRGELILQLSYNGHSHFTDKGILGGGVNILR